MKREDILTWGEYFAGLVHLSVKRGKDPSTQVGVVIANSEHRVVSIGYNGFPNGCNDDEFSWDREGDFGSTKYPYVVRAELNATLNSKHDLEGCSIYVSLSPCNECAKAIIQGGISRTAYESDRYTHTEGTTTSKRVLRSAGIELVQLPYAIDLQISRKTSPTIR